MRHLIAATIVVLALVVILALPSIASAWTASGFAKVTVNEDSFYTYDCETTTAGFGTVDWPVMVVFCGNASVAKVDAARSSRLPIWGIDELMNLSDGAGTRRVPVPDAERRRACRRRHRRPRRPRRAGPFAGRQELSRPAQPADRGGIQAHRGRHVGGSLAGRVVDGVSGPACF
jgi:hypothetical protein